MIPTYLHNGFVDEPDSNLSGSRSSFVAVYKPLRMQRYSSDTNVTEPVYIINYMLRNTAIGIAFFRSNV